MSIRNSAKAIIVNDDKILLNKYTSSTLGVYYGLPGGGQNQYESMEDALQRECLEETGYTIKVDIFVALYEEIYRKKSMREKRPDYAHKILHIFRCSLQNNTMKIEPVEKDAGQICSEWVPLAELQNINIFPICIRENIENLIFSNCPVYLGTHFID